MVRDYVKYAGFVWGSPVYIWANAGSFRVGEEYGCTPNRIRMNWEFSDHLQIVNFAHNGSDFARVIEIQGNCLVYRGFSSNYAQNQRFLEIVQRGLSELPRLELIKNLVDRGATICSRVYRSFTGGNVQDFPDSPGSLLELASDDCLLRRIQRQGQRRAIIANGGESSSNFNVFFFDVAPPMRVSTPKYLRR